MGPASMTEPLTARFHALYWHFHGAGCCGGHSVYLAVRAIEGPSFTAAPTWCRRTWCEVSARASWAKRPRQPPVKALPPVSPAQEATAP